jgi:hypothetical protein
MMPSSQRRSVARRALTALGAIAGCAAVPKCFGCIVVYLGVGAALGLRPGVELCGAGGAGVSITATALSAAAGIVGALLGLRRRWRCRGSMPGA